MLPAEPGVVAMAEDGEFVELFSRVELAGQALLRQVRKTALFARTEGYGRKPDPDDQTIVGRKPCINLSLVVSLATQQQVYGEQQQDGRAARDSSVHGRR